MKIHIYYRHYNVSGNDYRGRPEWFSFEKCWINLLNSLPAWNSNKYQINIIYDGKENDNNFILSSDPTINYYYIQVGADNPSFFKTCDIIKNDKNIKQNDLIYFLENDYLHVDGWIDKVSELYKTYNGIDYISLYDHNDKYFLPQYNNLVSKIITTKTHHWRTTPSTCGSFIIPKYIFDEDYDILSSMQGDHNKFLWLNENRNRTVFTPIPGLSTHCMEGLLSPTINWKQYIKKYEKI